MGKRGHFRLHPYEKGRLIFLHGYISEHAGETFSMQKIKMLTEMAASKIAPGFRLVFGKELSAFIREQKMLLAAGLLERTHEPVKYVAGKAGYKNVKSFHRAFKAYYGMTPGAYREQHQDPMQFAVSLQPE